MTGQGVRDKAVAPYTGPLRRKHRDAPGRTEGQVPEGFMRAQYALRHSGPLTAAEKAEYDALRAREMHRAERRRQPSPQLELVEAA